MKNIFLVFLGGLLLVIVGAEWNTASLGVNTILVLIGLLAVAVGILSYHKLSVPTTSVHMARHVDDEVPPRGPDRWGTHYRK